jgi:hypothetical protein
MIKFDQCSQTYPPNRRHPREGEDSGGLRVGGKPQYAEINFCLWIYNQITFYKHFPCWTINLVPRFHGDFLGPRLREDDARAEVIL